MQSLPSPAESPSLKPQQDQLPSNRKRQRSQSMQSDASSSSAKRSQSEGASNDNAIRSSLADNTSSQTITEIDAYMAEQGEDTIQLPEPVLSQNGTSPSMPPPMKFAKIKELRTQPMVIGDTWYIVARQWLRRWEKACSGEVDKEGGVDESALGPINNSSLFDKDGNVTSTLLEGIDVDFLPKEAWALFVTWYGEPIQPMPRKVISKGIMKESSLELRPPRLKVLLLQKSDSKDVTGPPHPYVTISISDTVRDLCSLLRSTIGPSKTGVARVWRIEPNADLTGSVYPSARLSEDKPELFEPRDDLVEDSLIEPDDVFVVEFLENGKFIIDPDKLPKSSSTGNDNVPPPLFSDENDFFKKMGSSSSSKAVVSTTKSNTSTLFKPGGFGSTLTRSHTPQQPGTLGLGNMGNTCFMNSALQCLAHSKELTEYFLSGVYKEELNPDNPLGMHGAIAEAFGSLLHRIWDPSSTSSSYSPREFKQQLQRFAPQFSGYQQHDSQELVAFLLDGLHEDLNRVLKKPYVEKPDWEGGGDKELVELAQKSWDGYMLRNDSVIVDLFQGQYQSTLVCPECNKVSITFDPFMYLTLPLPMQKKWKHEVYYIPWDLEKPHVKIPVEIGKDASMKDLRQILGRWMDANPDNLLTMEIFTHKFYKNLDDNVMCGEIQDNDIVVCFELPCHAQQSRTYKRSPNDPFILPVFLSENAPTQQRHYYKPGPSLFGYPMVAVIDQKQATDVDMMYDAVVDRLQRWTANARDLYKWEADSTDTPIRIVTGAHLPMDAPVTEIKENGEVVMVDGTSPEEGDIVDEKHVVIQETEAEAQAEILMDTTADGPPRKMGPKRDLFDFRLQVNCKEFGTGYLSYGAQSPRYEPWERRQEVADEHPVLLREDDALFCEFDENMKVYYFGDERSKWEHARWETWEQFIHPEYTEAKKANAERKNKGMTLDDCLSEFTKEEKLGEDDLWYCPQCKKHQQATKKFDLWKAPDILVVHLKRFSNSRMLRDKIDSLVEFPIDGLDIGDLVGERLAALRLKEAGLDATELGLKDLDEPLVYDLFAVDEHMGGLGGGHYRAFAANHMTDQWYHFDDSYVTKSRATEAVNANAYLLFYKRRTTRPLGGKSHDKIQEARVRQPAPAAASPEQIPIDTQLPTPPNESTHASYLNTGQSRLSALAQVVTSATLSPAASEGWPTPRSNAKSSPASSPPPLDDASLPTFDDAQFDSVLNPANLESHNYRFPDPHSKDSPTSSIDVEPDLEKQSIQSISIDTVDDWAAPHDWSEESDIDSTAAISPTSSSSRDENPFSDANKQKEKPPKGIQEVNKTVDVDM